MVSQKFGVLSVIASTGGLKFIGKDQKWMNPPNKATPEEVESLKKMRSKKVCITFNDKGEYVSCGITATDNKDIPTHPETDNKSAPQQAKTGQIDRETSIVRQTCLKVAGEVAKSNMFPMPAEGYKAIGHLAADILTLAEELEEWVNRK